jgi:uncharacterized protein (TIGR02231 family)
VSEGASMAPTGAGRDAEGDPGLPPCPSRAVRVTLFEDRAEVTRRASVPASSRAAWVSLAGVSPYVDERSVQARALGEVARVLAARVRFRAHRERALGREEIDALEAEARRAERDEASAKLALDRAERAAWHAETLTTEWLEGVAAAPRGARAAEAIAAWREALGSVDRLATEALDQAATARDAQGRAAEALSRAQARLAEGKAEKPRYEARIEVLIAASTEGTAELEVTYRVPSALWRPEHLVRIARVPEPSAAEGGAPTAPIEITTIATAWQRTGEVWDDVEARFSTARPALAASPPLLTEDVLVARRKTPVERSRVEVDLREQSVALAGLERGARAVDEMPGVDDGGEPVLLAPRERVSIASDGRSFRVEVQRVTVTALIERVLFPEIAPVAHLRATATLTKGGPLLAGPVRIVRGESLVGRAKVGYVGKGEPFEVGLGVDDGVRVRREQTEQRETVPVIGTQKIRRKVKVYLSNLSSEARRVLVTERLPVSEIGDVEISLLEPGGFRLEAQDGFLKRDVDLGPNATETLELGYEIRAGSKVVLPS